MAYLLVLIGISGCGKSTFANGLNANVVSTDAIRGELFGDESCQDDPGRVFELAHNRAERFLKSGQNVVFDATNVSRWSRDELMKHVPSGTKKICGLFLIEPSEALRRQENRARKVSKDVIVRQWETLMKDSDSIPNEFDEVIIA